MRVLVTAPFVGEVGWELMAWQGRVRRLFHAGGYDQLVVAGAARKSGFYDDMPLDYRTVDLSGLPGVAYEDRRCDRDSRQPVDAGAIRQLVSPSVEQVVSGMVCRGHEVETLWPAYEGRFLPCHHEHQEFIRFHGRCPKPGPNPWVVLVKRTRDFGADNWSKADWHRIEQGLRRRGIQTSTLPHDSTTAIEMLSACDLAVGQSTGGLHLAALCGCPHLVWGFPYFWSRWSLTNRQRYETIWNPLATPVRMYEIDQLPDPRDAVEETVTTLFSIGRRSGSRVCRALMRSKLQLRGWIARTVVMREWFSRWPWTVQQFVRYRMV